MDKVKCPYCGYKMPIFVGENAKAEDLWVKCKGRKCGKVFEIKIKQVK
nr:MAG TPA: cysteine-rich protein [Caudoviricetes sp.]